MSELERTTDLAEFGYKQELKRALGLRDLLVYGLVFIIPTAPIATFGIVFNISHGMVPLVYIVGFVAMFFTALSYVAMSREYPIAGSVYAYAARSLGSVPGFVAGWAILLDYFFIPTVIYVACAIAMHSALPGIPKPFWIVGLLTAATLVNYFGIETTARTTLILLGFQLLMLTIVMGLELNALAHHVAGAQLSWRPLFNRAEFNPAIIFGGLSIAVGAFLGFDAVSTLAEEASGGPDAVGRATILSLCLTGVLFVAQSYLASLFVLNRTGFPPGDATDAAFYNIIAGIGGYWLKFYVAVSKVLFASFACAIAAQAATARLLFSMARDGKLPRVLARVHPGRKVPSVALLLVAAVTVALAITLVNSLQLLASMVSFGALLGFLMLHASVIAHFIVRQRSRAFARYLVAPCVGMAIIGYVLWNAPDNAKIAGGLWLVAGLVMLAVLRATGRSTALATE
ncbi:MAG TPA: APC family permease [Rhizomicrobium sp.]|jgi:amino acid transporter